MVLYQEVVKTEREKYEDDLKILPTYGEIKETYRGKEYIIRRVNLGHLCGYTYIDDDESFISSSVDHTMCETPFFHAYGGITYHMDTMIGFDTCHSEDWSPLTAQFFDNGGVATHRTYKDVEFVRNECKRLIDQIIAKRRPSYDSDDE